jgi:hypothetical protein
LHKGNAMGKQLVLALVGCGVLWLAGPVRGEDTADAKAIVDKAIKAHGGEEKLSKFKGETWTGRGTYYGMGDGLPFTGHFAVQWPDRFRMEIEGAFIVVVDGDKGWTKSGNGDAKEMTKDELAFQKESLYAQQVERLLVLKEKEFTLVPLEATKVDGKPAVGVKVSHKGHDDIKLYFDRDTNLLVKCERRVKASEQGFKEVTQETFFKDWKDVDGIKVVQKVVDKRDDKPYVEEEVSDVKYLEKVEAKLFGKP